MVLHWTYLSLGSFLKPIAVTKEMKHYDCPGPDCVTSILEEQPPFKNCIEREWSKEWGCSRTTRVLLSQEGRVYTGSAQAIKTCYTLWRASLVAQMVKHLPAMQETWVRSPGLGRSPGEGNGNPLQYSCLDNPMDGGVTVCQLGSNQMALFA